MKSMQNKSESNFDKNYENLLKKLDRKVKEINPAIRCLDAK